MMVHTPRKNAAPCPRCVYCGALATTRDHVPPKNLFLAPRPSDLITVDACESCNNGSSAYDERFRTFISLSVGTQQSKALALWKKGAFPSLLHNRDELRRMAGTMQEVPMYTKGGIYLGHATTAFFEQEPHDSTIRRITSGLYSHEFAESLPKSCPIEVFIVDATDPGWEAFLRQILPHMAVRSIGGEDVFEYAFARAPERPQSSLWLFRFYSGHVVHAATGGLAACEE